MRGLRLAIAMGLTAAAGGCSRTDDGSVTMADPLHVGRYLRPAVSPPITPPVPSGMQVFPVSSSGQAPRQARQGRPSSAGSGERRPSGGNGAPETPITCHDAMAAGGRVHVVCE